MGTETKEYRHGIWKRDRWKDGRWSDVCVRERERKREGEIEQVTERLTEIEKWN